MILALADLLRSTARLETALMDYASLEETLTENELETVVEPQDDPE